MTRISRPKQPHHLTLMRIIIFLLSIGAFTVLLFWLDSDFVKKDRKKPAKPVLTPDKLLFSPEMLRKAAPQEEVPAAEPAVEEAAGKQKEPEALSKDEAKPKRYKIELASLQGGATGSVLMETRTSWAPIGVKHFEELVADKFYDQCRFFRVLPNFVVQFGINGSPEVQSKWRHDLLKDDPVVQTNSRGTITYATSGKNSRTTQLFINKKDNAYLDKEGFAPFGEIIQGMEIVDKIVDEYKEKPNQGKIQNQGNAYLEKEFPTLSYIVSVREVLEEGAGLDGHADALAA